MKFRSAYLWLHVQFIRMPVASDPFQHTFNLEPDAWARAEFAHAELGDERRTQRLVAIASDFAWRPTAPITQATGVWASAKAAYRSMDNDDIDPGQSCHRGDAQPRQPQQFHEFHTSADWRSFPQLWQIFAGVI
jgi:hypothetical protein